MNSCLPHGVLARTNSNRAIFTEQRTASFIFWKNTFRRFTRKPAAYNHGAPVKNAALVDVRGASPALIDVLVSARETEQAVHTQAFPMSSKFPPGLLNPGPLAPASGFCERFLRVECPSGREFVFNLFFSSYGVWMLLPLSVLLLLVYRLVGPPEVCGMGGGRCVWWCCSTPPLGDSKHQGRFNSMFKLSSQHLWTCTTYFRRAAASCCCLGSWVHRTKPFVGHCAVHNMAAEDSLHRCPRVTGSRRVRVPGRPRSSRANIHV